MCRMIAARAPRGDDLVDLLLSFRDQGRASAKGPETEHQHRDGWGLFAFGAGSERLVFRRPTDATNDDVYETAVRSLAGFTDPLAIVHLRNASVGLQSRENTHPFSHDGWWFCHNGTIKDPATLELRGVRYEGSTDSERYFRRLVRALRTDVPSRALMNASAQVEKLTPFTSLTSFLTNGRDLYAHRRMGDDLEDCGTRDCQAEYYTLGLARKGDVTLIAQEPTHLGRLADWTEIPDGAVVDWPAGESPRILPSTAPLHATSRSR